MGFIADLVGLALVQALCTFNALLAQASSRSGRGGDSTSLVFVFEAAKLLLALVWVSASARDVRAQFVSWASFLRMLVRYSVPALVYLMLNNLLIWTFAELGALNTVLWGSLKIPATAFCSFLFLGRHFSWTQVLICASSILAEPSPGIAVVGSGLAHGWRRFVAVQSFGALCRGHHVHHRGGRGL
jgi:hypothetical protein